MCHFWGFNLDWHNSTGWDVESPAQCQSRKSKERLKNSGKVKRALFEKKTTEGGELKIEEKKWSAKASTITQFVHCRMEYTRLCNSNMERLGGNLLSNMLRFYPDMPTTGSRPQNENQNSGWRVSRPGRHSGTLHSLWNKDTLSLRQESVMGIHVLITFIAIFWNLRPCSPVEVRWRFGGTCCLRISSSCLLASLTLRPWRWGQYVPPKCRWTSTWLYGVISLRTMFCNKFFFSVCKYFLLQYDSVLHWRPYR
jgi:hypothetical protein